MVRVFTPGGVLNTEILVDLAKLDGIRLCEEVSECHTLAINGTLFHKGLDHIKTNRVLSDGKFYKNSNKE